MSDMIRLKHPCGCETVWAADLWGDQAQHLARIQRRPCPHCQIRPTITAKVYQLLQLYGTPDRALFALGWDLNREALELPFWASVVDRLLTLACIGGKGDPKA
jgi:hypothetical protein